MTIVQTDQRSRVVLPGRKDELFLMNENSDGSILLQPAVVVSAAQREYDESSELQELLSDALASKTVRRRRRSK
ncbi:MAG: hypothetical protein WAS05_09950 [Candidatus Nanopelagicales bacterium]